jgi:hypothetical protein
MSAAQEALDKAERLDGYRAACAASELNAAARAGQEYKPSFLDKSTLDRLYTDIFEVPIMLSTDVVVLASTADNGYPHTRPNSVVCLPKSAVLSMSSEAMQNTLCHEGVHIHQRRNPALWSQACHKEGWTPVNDSEIPSEFLDRCRLNPDTFKPQRFWAWQTHYVPMPLFTREDYPTMEGIQVKWLDRRMGALFVEPPPSFSKRYGQAPPQPEHPFELLAVEYAEAKLNTDEKLRAKLMSL